MDLELRIKLWFLVLFVIVILELGGFKFFCLLKSF